jgi:hypothetical protein
MTIFVTADAAVIAFFASSITANNALYMYAALVPTGMVACVCAFLTASRALFSCMRASSILAFTTMLSVIRAPVLWDS